MVLGEGGILDMAKEAADKTKNSAANDQADIENLAGDIENFVYGSGSGNSDSESDTLTEAEKEAITIGEARKTGDYGRIVNDYSAGGVNTWRLFYQDDNYTYIIADELVGSYNLKTDYEKSDYENGSKVSKIGQNLNPQLKNTNCDKGCKFFEAGNTNENIRAVAWLTDEKQWQKYATGRGALYAIGSPTAELFAASYNAVQDVNKITLEPKYCGFSIIDNEQNEKWLKAGEYGGIYNKDGAGFWWLASPGFFWHEELIVCMLYVEEMSCCMSMNSLNGTSAVRPIVCFRTTVFNDTYTLGDM